MRKALILKAATITALAATFVLSYNNRSFVVNADATETDATEITTELETEEYPTYNNSNRVYVDSSTFPDQAFRNYVLAHFTDPDGFFTGANYTSRLDLDIKGIKDLTGIEYFTSITDLSFRENQIESVDLSHNTALEYVRADDNCLKNINLGNLPNLKTIVLSGNPDLFSIDISGLSAINTLNASDCSLSSIEFGENCPLKNLYVKNNNLTSISLNDIPGLENLEIYKNALSILDITNNHNLVKLRCEDNDIEELDITACKDLEYLSCSNNSIEFLDLTGKTKLETLEAYQNNLNSLNFADCNSIQFINLAINNISELQSISDKEELQDLYINSNNIENIEIYNCPKLEKIECGNNNAKKIELGSLPSLKCLLCYNNQLESIDLSTIPTITRLDCSENKIKQLETSSCKNLENLYCPANNLEELDLSENDSIVSINCSNNPIDKFTFGDLTHLTTFTCVSARCKNALDLSGAKNIKTINLDMGYVKYLVVDPDIELEGITWYGNDSHIVKINDNGELKWAYLDPNTNKINPNYTGIAAGFFDYDLMDRYVYLFRDGTVDTEYTGLINTYDYNDDSYNMLYRQYAYFKNGVFTKRYEGSATDEDGKWYLVKDGYLNQYATGLYPCIINGVKATYLFNKGCFDTKSVGLMYYGSSRFYIKNGTIDTSANGPTSAKFILSDEGKSWYYLKNGKVNTNYNDLAKIGSTWFKFTSGKQDKTFKGFAKKSNGTYYFCSKGKIQSTFTGIKKGTINNKEAEYFVKNGVYKPTYRGIVKYGNYKYYVNKGKISRTTTGTVKIGNSKYQVSKGRVIKKLS